MTCHITTVAALAFLALSFSPSAPQIPKWQTDWPLFVAELSQHLRKGIDPSELPAFNGKSVTFEGVMGEAYSGESDTIKVEMDPTEISVALSLFPLPPGSKVKDPARIVTLNPGLRLKPRADSKDAWRAVSKGARIRFRGTLGSDLVVLVVTGNVNSPNLGGLALLYLGDAELAGK